MQSIKTKLFNDRQTAKGYYDIAVKEYRENPTMENLSNLRKAHKHLLDCEAKLRNNQTTL